MFAYDGDNLVEETNSRCTVVARYAQQGLNIDESLAMLHGGTTSSSLQKVAVQTTEISGLAYTGQALCE